MFGQRRNGKKPAWRSVHEGFLGRNIRGTKARIRHTQARHLDQPHEQKLAGW